MKAVRALLAVLAVAITFTVARRLIVDVRFERVAVDGPVIVLGAALVVTFGGLAVWQLRPTRTGGPLMTVAGFGVLIGSMAGIRPIGLDIVGSFAALCSPLAIGHVLLAYPDGLSALQRRAVAVTCWIVPALLGSTVLLTANSWEPARLLPYVRHSLRGEEVAVVDWPAVARWGAVANGCWIAVAAVVIATVVVVRAVRATRPMRSMLTPVACAGCMWAITTLAAVPYWSWTIRTFRTFKAYELLFMAGVILPAVGAGLVAGAIVWSELVRPRLDPVHDGRIVLTGEALPVADVLRRRLATAIGDPSLRLAIMGTDGAWLSPAGKPIALRDDGERATTTLTRNGDVIAAVEHDHALRATPDIVVVATTMAGLAIDNVRLAALDAAQLEEMRSSGELLLAAADRARHQVAATIELGPAAKLDRLTRRVAQGDDSLDLGGALRQIASEVRAISHGVYPPELERGGLAAALDLADEVPARRYPPAVELTAFLVAAGQTGARLVDDDGQLIISVAGPLSDHAHARIHALDGSVHNDGHVLVVTIPVQD